MISTLWTMLLVKPIFNILLLFNYFTGNLGFSIILFTIFIRLILLPIAIPSMRTMNKQKDLQPEIEKIRKKYKDDKQKQAQAQMELFKEHGLNPASGCLTQIPMLIVLIAVFGVIQKITSLSGNDISTYLYFDVLKASVSHINLSFLGWDMGKPDSLYILPILSGIAQFAVSKVSFGFNKKAEIVAKDTPDKKDDIAYNMQQQMLYIMPVMTAYISTKLPSGVVLYIIATSIFSFVQTYLLLGGNKQKELLKKLGSK